MFRKVLVANRGEIAVRVIRALRELGIASVAVYSDADRASLHVRVADEAIHIGPSASAESYLRIDKILAAAHKTGAEAIHPGYGFLSENADFAAACDGAGIVFIGPSAESIRRMGSKTAARLVAIAAGAPVVPGTEKPVSDIENAKAVARSLGYPVLLKAAAGGGGKGMRLVAREADLEAAARDAMSEAERAFSSSEVYLEKAVLHPRHIEIQIFGDQHGNLIHLGERECSIQRRHQKVIEECPSPLMTERPELRQQMGEAAVRIARHVGYYNAGTMEFLVDEQANFYFLEMNTRLQVEHPVTELATSLDLVHLQLRVAAGEPLGIRQEDVSWSGAAIECRVYAEDPSNNFMPSPGRVTHWEQPSGPGVRVDSGVYEGWTIPLEYDPLLAKFSVRDNNRLDALDRMRRALHECVVGGIQSNLEFFDRVLADPVFRSGRIHTGFIPEFLADPKRSKPPVRPVDAEAEEVAALVAALHYMSHKTELPVVTPNGGSRWVKEGRAGLYR